MDVTRFEIHLSLHTFKEKQSIRDKRLGR